MDSEKYKFELMRQRLGHKSPVHGDMGIINVPVKVIFEWSDKIIADYDSETDTVLEYKEGYIMKVINNQEYVYENQDIIPIGHAYINDNKQK